MSRIPVFEYAVFENFEFYNTLVLFPLTDYLRACPREHREIMLHAISPISMKLCQFKGSTPKLKKTDWFLFRFFPGEDRPYPPAFLGFH